MIYKEVEKNTFEMIDDKDKIIKLSDLTGSENLEQLEAGINHYKKKSIIDVIEIGRRLKLAKNHSEYGAYGNWKGFLDRVGLEQSNATRFMRLADNLFLDDKMTQLDKENFEMYEDLNQTQALKLLDISDLKLRQEFCKNNSVEQMSKNELQSAVNKFKTDKGLKSKSKKKEDVKIDESMDIYEEIIVYCQGGIEQLQLDFKDDFKDKYRLGKDLNRERDKIYDKELEKSLAGLKQQLFDIIIEYRNRANKKATTILLDELADHVAKMYEEIKPSLYERVDNKIQKLIDNN